MALVYPQNCSAITTINFRTFSLPQKETHTPSLPPLQFLHITYRVHWFLLYSQLCNHHHKEMIEKETLYPLASMPLNTNQYTILLSLFWTLHKNQIIQCGHLPWFFSLSLMFSKFICVIACISSFSWPNNIPLKRYTILFIHSSIDRHLSCFQIMNNATMNNNAQVFVWRSIFNSLGKISRSVVAESCDV